MQANTVEPESREETIHMVEKQLSRMNKSVGRTGTDVVQRREFLVQREREREKESKRVFKLGKDQVKRKENDKSRVDEKGNMMISAMMVCQSITEEYTAMCALLFKFHFLTSVQVGCETKKAQLNSTTHAMPVNAVGVCKTFGPRS